MKKLLIILGIMLLSGTAGAGGISYGIMNSPVVGGGPSCTTITDSETSATAWDRESIVDVAHTYLGTRFSAGSSYTLCGVDVYLKKAVTDSSPVWVIRAEIWSDNTTVPSALLATSTTTKTAADLSTAYGWINFSFAGVSLTSGTYYWIVVKGTTIGDWGDFFYWSVSSAYTRWAYGNATPTWTSGDSETLNYRTYR